MSRSSHAEPVPDRMRPSATKGTPRATRESTRSSSPVPEAVASIVAGSLRRLLLGQDPVAGEKLWDLRGRWLGQPLYRLLGGPTRTAVPAYASMLGFAVLDPGRVRERAQDYRRSATRRRSGSSATAP